MDTLTINVGKLGQRAKELPGGSLKPAQRLRAHAKHSGHGTDGQATRDESNAHAM